MTVSTPCSFFPTDEHFFSIDGSSYVVCVIPGDASVSPYTMVISFMFILSTTSSIAEMGQGDPAMIPVLKDEKSNLLNSL